MLFTINVLPLLLMYLLIGRLVERFGTTDWGRIFVMAAATLGTFLNTFAVVLNNHIIGGRERADRRVRAVRIAFDGERRLRYFALAGLAAAFTAADELPALSFLGLIGLLLLWNAPRQTLVAFVPAMLVVVAAFFATNWIAHAEPQAALHAPRRRRRLVRLRVRAQRPQDQELLAGSPRHRSRRTK